MKKHLDIGILALTAGAMFLSTAFAIAVDYGDAPSADVAKQGQDFYDKAEYYNELKARLGPIPKPAKPIKLGFCCKAFENEFWRLIRDGSEVAVANMKKAGIDISIDVRAAQGETDENGQLALMSDMVKRGYDGILCSPISDGNLLPAVERARANKTPLIMINSTFMAAIEVSVGARHWRAGELAAEWMSQRIGEGEVAIITGMMSSSSARSRTEGFTKWFAVNNPGIKVVDVQNGNWDRMKAKDVADVLLKKHPNLRGIYCNNDTMAMGAIESIKSAGRLGKCYLLGTDGTSEAHASIRAGELSGTVDNMPKYISQVGIEMMIRRLGGQEVPKVIYTPGVVIDKSNVDEDIEKLIGWEKPVFK
ncbi:MAG: substrate-binding domain-containing protein [Planctomycetota bacterium]|jgi:ribose transport system substrate-binding protein|nr:substrate-binding domain-containing protein [Planctomycetota bacterium]